MEQNYRITIYTTEVIIEGSFYRKEIAISTVIDFKKRFDDFLIGILSKKIKGEWVPICSIVNGRSSIIYYL